ncbi:pectin lyase-like protein [Clavulina sp. PMI_390]|nr:pectin lyase-like protein [Clavulina sp. PMI_390]
MLAAKLTIAALSFTASTRAYVTSRATKTCTVASSTSGSDAGPSILAAFTSCNNGGQVVLNGTYSVGTLLDTSSLNLNNLEIVLSGTLQYTNSTSKWPAQAKYLTYQNATTFFFLAGTNIHLHGGSGASTIDGNGQAWYDAFASNANLMRPIPLTIGNGNNVLVENLKIIQSPMWSNFVYQSKGVVYKNITLTSKSSSSNAAKNTDGWDIYRSDNVTIENSTIVNGDDCVSFKPNSTNIVVTNLSCTGSHGISVGSLGQYAGEVDIVENVYVKGITMTSAQNGARIKAWAGSASSTSTAGGGSGYVKNITFANFVNSAVDNPVVIDQCYMGTTAGCQSYPSKVIISDVHYINVTGSSSGSEGKVVASLECSSPCNDITATGTSLTSPKGTAVYDCRNITSEASLDFKCTEV